MLLTSRKPPTRRVMLNEDELVEYIQNRWPSHHELWY